MCAGAWQPFIHKVASDIRLACMNGDTNWVRERESVCMCVDRVDAGVSRQAALVSVYLE